MIYDFMNPDFCWNSLSTLQEKSYLCGNCSKHVSSETGYPFGPRVNMYGVPLLGKGLYICPNCKYPTLFTLDGDQIPGPLLGISIKNIDDDIKIIYDEIRNDIANGCYTSAILLSRKFLMHIAVREGALENQGFKYYVNYLTDEFLPKRNKPFVEKIRENGNDANHVVSLNTFEDANEMLNYIELLLLNLYEYHIEVNHD